MSKIVAVLADDAVAVVSINVHPDDYEPQPGEVSVVGPAWVGGTYVDGYSYPPQPFPSWSMNGEGNWQPPTPMPTAGRWDWDEDTLSWVEVTA